MAKRSSKFIILIFGVVVILNGIYFVLRLYNSTRIEIIDFTEIVNDIGSDDTVITNSILIESIRVGVDIGESEEYLNFGGWVQNLNSNSLPLVISIHRFGERFLHSDFEVSKTLFHIDKLSIGDALVLFWEGEKYEYFVSDIYEGVNNKPIGDNELLLYTCKYWYSDYRVFVVFSRDIG